MTTQTRDPEFDLDGEDTPGTPYHPAEGRKDAYHESVPDDVRSMMVELDGLKEYSVTTYRIEGSKRTQIDKATNSFREPDEIGEVFGPGDYELVFSWKVPDRKTPSTKRFPISIGREYASRHAAYMARISPPVTQGANVDQTLEHIGMLAKILMPGGNSGNKGDSVMEIVKLQNEMMQKNLDRLERQAEKDREEARRVAQEHRQDMKDLLSAIANRKEPSLIEEIEKMRTLAPMLGFGQGPGPVEDNRPVWMQAIEMVGEKAMPLIEAMMSQSKLKRSVATSKLTKAMGSDVGQKLLQDQAQQKLFLENLFSRTPPEKRSGILEMVRALRLDPSVIPEQYRIQG